MRVEKITHLCHYHISIIYDVIKIKEMGETCGMHRAVNAFKVLI
jgi:hypothetical protein